MTEHIAALDALIEAVEDGALPDEDWRLMHDIWSPRNWHEIGHNVRYSMHGSLDAAKALHEALLHDRYAVSFQYSKRYEGRATIIDPMDSSSWDSGVDRINPARAWLIAILKAYRAVL